jgi:hypothetical protein
MSNAKAKPMMDVTEEQAAVLIGKHILVGVAHCDSEGATVSREQFHGIVNRANLTEGVVINLYGSNKERAVPLELSCLQIARLGEYQLTGTHEVVKDPDYTLRITLHPDEYKG